ncbi:lia operon protein LiaI [Lentibacillus halodurans]|uniref:Lia operon protein LiaI n=1 Tax=Lentibacillus halodurans TaxID=237679 RepID=A0A1I0WPA3_9BACI|nr:flagellar basal body rod protein [Lentibacillus halodurans]SFA90028.1 lia operon protein LiaI [Lentibacillus halodurans]
MKKFMLFVGGLLAFFILLANLGPMILLGISIWLLYVIFKQFVKSDSTAGKIGWIIAGIFALAIGLSNIYAIIGAAAAYALYLIYTSWKNDAGVSVEHAVEENDPFKNFERQWAEMNR